MTEDEMVGWHHRLDGHEFEQVPGEGEGQGSLACCSPLGCKESDMTSQLNNNNVYSPLLISMNLTRRAGRISCTGNNVISIYPGICYIELLLQPFWPKARAE